MNKTPTPTTSRTKARNGTLRYFWIIWLLLSLGLIAYFYVALTSLEKGDDSTADVFLPGDTTHGHHQIEMACIACHTEPFGGKELLQNACMNCHAAELERVEDSHPIKKFKDPRNAELLTKIDARFCIACHVEHKPDMVHAMGVTQPDNMCIHCHADVGENRPTHLDLDFVSCGTSGCHNFHDNKALYEDFLLRHSDKPMHLPTQQVSARDLMTVVAMDLNYPRDQYPLKALGADDMDAPQPFEVDHGIKNDWLTTQHAKAGVNCTACHEAKAPDSDELRWVNKPDHTSCQSCHTAETDSFMDGKHGMRLKAGLSPLTPEQARLPMNPLNKHKQLNCISCHAAHDFDTRFAAKEACLQCHTDDHSTNFAASPHAKLWDGEISGMKPEGSGVSCATCHMPRVDFEDDNGNERLLVDHNQNNTLRPNDKMLRPVCMECHGLGFAMDALADPALIKNNFSGHPTVHVESIDMALEADRVYREKKAAEKAAREKAEREKQAAE